MDQSVKMPCRLLYLFAHLIVAVEIEHVGDEVQGVLVVCDISVQAGEIEAVGEVIFVDFAKVLIAAGRDELYIQMLA